MAVPDEVEAAPPQISAQPDVLWAAAVGVIAVAVYVRTLTPGMIPISDTPALQFVGRVLGVAHNPGYPTYVLLTYSFSYLPVGSLAYQINLFSALLGGLTAALTILLRDGLAAES